MRMCETTHYRPFRVARSFSLLGIFEEWSFLSLLSLCRLTTEVRGGLGVAIVISVRAALCRVYPPVSRGFRRLLCNKDDVGSLAQCGKLKEIMYANLK